MKKLSKQQIFHLILAFCVFISIIVDFSSFALRAKDELTTTKIINYFSFFTIFSNFCLGITSAILAFCPHSLQKNGIKAIKISGTVCMIITFFIFNIVLRPIFTPPTLVSTITNEFYHVINPILGVVAWLWVDKTIIVSKRTLLFAMIAPIGYAIYMFIRGAVMGFYPYFFLNVTKLGYPKVLLVVAMVTITFVCITLIMGKIEKKMFTPKII